MCHFFPGKCTSSCVRERAQREDAFDKKASIQAGNQVEKLRGSLFLFFSGVLCVVSAACVPPFGGIWNSRGGDAIFTVHMIFFEIGASIGR